MNKEQQQYERTNNIQPCERYIKKEKKMSKRSVNT